MNIKASFAVLTLCFAQLAFCLEPGDQAPELSTAKFLAGNEVKLADLKDKSPCLIEFFASWSDDGVEALKTLSKLKRDFAKDKLEVVAVSSEQEKDLLALSAKLKKDGVSVALDDKSASEAAYMSSEPVLPTFFLVDKKGVLLWKGHASDLLYIVKRFSEGKFTVEDSKKVSALRKTIAEALAAKSLNKAIESSDDLLNILPADSETVKLRLAIYEMQGNRRQSLDFLDSLIEKAPGEASLYFSKLDVMLHSDPKAKSTEIAQFAEKAFEAMKDSPEDLNNLAWILLDETEFAEAPLATVLKASKLSVETLAKDSDGDLRAACLDTLARIYFSVGRIDKAIELQTQALELWKGCDDEARCTKVLDFYKAALELGKAESK